MPTNISSDIVSYANSNVTANGTEIITSSSNVDTDMFLKLLVAQMTNQDPFSQDQDPTKYVTQLAQFSQLEQMQQFNSNVEMLASINNGVLVNSALSAATNMIGHEAEFYSTDENAGYNDTIKGVVESVYIEDGSVYLELKVDGSDELKSVRYDTLLKITNK